MPGLCFINYSDMVEEGLSVRGDVSFMNELYLLLATHMLDILGSKTPCEAF